MTTSRWMRVGGWSLIVGGIMGIATRYVWFLAHGPTEFNENNLVLGMRTIGATRLEILPELLSIVGITVFYYSFRGKLNRAGRYALAAVLAGSGLALFRLIWDFFLFPHPHSLFGIGWGVLFFFGFPLITLGWLTFGISSLRLPPFPYWVKILPFIMGGSIILAFLYDPLPNRNWSKLLQFTFQNEIETILMQLAGVGLGVFLLGQSLSREDLHSIETT